MSVTIKDVAAVVGVSASTVSRAFSRPDKVDAATRERILSAAQSLGYTPNRAAQMLNTGRSMCIGAVLPDIENPFFASILKGIEQEAGELGYQTLVADTGEDTEAERRAIRALAGRVDGLLLCSPRLEDDEIAGIARETAVVLTNRSSDGLPHVSFDNADGIRQAVTHLKALGHTSIGYVSGDLVSRSARQRLTAFEQVVDEPNSGAVVGIWEPTFEGGSRSADYVLASGVTAVVVYNDLMAIGLMHRLFTYGVPVPERLSVVGFDDIPVAGMVTPALTSVATPRVEAGRMAARRLHEVIEGRGEDASLQTVLATRLAARGSTSACHPVPAAD